MKYQVVVARYNESIDWIEPIKDLCVIYNKGDSNIRYPCTHMDNIGREAHTYLVYILDNYDNLPDYMLFTQARLDDHILYPVQHITDGILQVKDMKLEHNALAGYTGLNQREGVGGWNLIRNFNDAYDPDIPLKEWWFEVYESPPDNDELLVNYCGIFQVSKERILFHGREFYERLYQLTLKDEKVSAYVLERLWTTMFDGETKSKYQGKSLDLKPPQRY